MAQNTAAAVGSGNSEPTINLHTDGPKTAAPRRSYRRDPKWTVKLTVRLDAVDHRALMRLQQAYGRDACSLMRDFIREKYADLQEDSVPTQHNDEFGLPPTATAPHR